MRIVSPSIFTVVFVALFVFPFYAAFGLDAATMSALRERAAQWMPLQSDVEVDTIAEEEIPLCELVISEDARQMRLLSPQRVVLRNFADKIGRAHV